MIPIRRTAEDDRLEFEVVVREGEGRPITTSRCRENASSWRASTRRSILEAAFRFLLDRERKESSDAST
jgi:hypothetical protein